MAFSNTFKVFLVLLVLSAMLSPEVDARRRILKGRKTVTRTYLRDAAIPAWAIVILVAVGEIIVGVVVFVVMKRIVIDPPIVGSYTPAPLEEP